MSQTLLIGFLVVSTAFGLLLEQVQAVRIGYAAGDARERLRRQREVNADLHLELARLASPERLSREARERLGMTPARPEHLVFLPVADRPSDPPPSDGLRAALGRPDDSGGQEASAGRRRPAGRLRLLARALFD